MTTGQPRLDAPFPWFLLGGKRKVAPVVWQRFGDVPNYVEPFFGSGAVLLNRPHQPRVETINDKDGFVANFWRAVQHNPEQTARHADNPVNENDLHARHAWLVKQRETLTARLEGDPAFYDVKIAGWWAWGVSCWIGSGFCSGEGPWVQDEETGQLVHLKRSQGVKRQLVHLSAAQGVNRQLVHLSGSQGVNRKRVQLRNGGEGVVKPSMRADLLQWFEDLAERLRHVRVCCGDWTRVMGPSPTWAIGLTGVFLDPPYDLNERDELYSVETDVSAAVREWCIANGNNPLLRIALCGYEGEHEMPPEWECYAWQSTGGYGLQGDQRGRLNRDRERIWFSPACLKPELQGVLL